MRTRIFTAALFACAFSLGSAGAADKPLTAQQQKMSTCSQEAKAKALTGDARQTFMSECLKAEHAAKNAQQERMKDCNQQAAGKKGAERQDFMSKCLSGAATATAPAAH
jgi:hypothetical protein